MRTVAFAAAWLLVAAHVHAQTATDPRWTPFLGCWELVAQAPPQTGTRPEGNPGAERSPIVRERRGARVCVEPQGAGVSMTTTVGEKPVLTQTVVADTTPHPIVDDTCRGTERAEWSSGGRQLFSRATLDCPGEPERSVSGIMLMSGDGHWIDVQSVTVASRETVRVRHYRRAPEQTNDRTAGRAGAEAARIRTQAADGRLTVEDVIEASRKVSAGAVEATLIESGARFPLSGRTLLTLDAAGVPDSVTDLMVALSYPRAFVVKRTSRDDRLTSFDPYGYIGPWGMADPLFGPFAADVYGSYFDSGYYYSPFGYSYLRTYPVLLGGGTFGTSVGSAGAASEDEGRVINGLGYTRVMTTRNAETLAASDASSSARGASDRGRVTTEGYTGGDTRSNSGGGSTNSGGSSGASSGGDSGRTAVPR